MPARTGRPHCLSFQKNVPRLWQPASHALHYKKVYKVKPTTLKIDFVSVVRLAPFSSALRSESPFPCQSLDVGCWMFSLERRCRPCALTRRPRRPDILSARAKAFDRMHRIYRIKCFPAWIRHHPVHLVNPVSLNSMPMRCRPHFDVGCWMLDVLPRTPL